MKHHVYFFTLISVFYFHGRGTRMWSDWPLLFIYFFVSLLLNTQNRDISVAFFAPCSRYPFQHCVTRLLRTRLCSTLSQVLYVVFVVCVHSIFFFCFAIFSFAYILMWRNIVLSLHTLFCCCHLLRFLKIQERPIVHFVQVRFFDSNETFLYSSHYLFEAAVIVWYWHFDHETNNTEMRNNPLLSLAVV